MVVLATLCLVVMAVSAWEAALSARNILVILRQRPNARNLSDIRTHRG